MAPKKTSGGYKAGKEPAAVGKNDSKDSKWVRSQLTILNAQKSTGPEWLEEHHAWHEEQMEELLQRLAEGSVKELPVELREGFKDYIAQFADQTVEEDEFYIDLELYSEVLAPNARDAPLASYVRAGTSADAADAVTKLKEWTDITRQGVGNLEKLMVKFAESAEVQEAGLTKIGGLLAAAKDSTSAPAGLTPAVLTPVVIVAMCRFPRDAGVQRAACAVFRGIVVVGGVTLVADAGVPKLVVSAMKAHVLDVEVARMGAGVLYAIIQKTDATSQERLAVTSTDAHQVLAQVLSQHPTDRALDRAVRVTMPELCG